MSHDLVPSWKLVDLHCGFEGSVVGVPWNGLDGRDELLRALHQVVLQASFFVELSGKGGQERTEVFQNHGRSLLGSRLGGNRHADLAGTNDHTTSTDPLAEVLPLLGLAAVGAEERLRVFSFLFHVFVFFFLFVITL